VSEQESRRELKFLHTSDVHLGAYDHSTGESTLRRRQEMHDTFRAVIDMTIIERVDFMVIAGDFFDNARVQEETLHFAGEQLARVPAPVVIAPGNHDHVGPNSVYDRIDLTELAPNLRLMRRPEGESVTLEHINVELWGRSHTEQDPNFTPFNDAPGRGDAEWHIGIGHGHFLHPMSADHSSYHIYEDHFAALDHDYFALGHWEQQTRVAAGNGLAAYSGAPDGLAGHTGGRVLMVHLERDGNVRLVSHPLREGAERLDHNEIPYLEGSPLPDR
jgi:DNA repair exonuclease SbcCD nuclease subunit